MRTTDNEQLVWFLVGTALGATIGAGIALLYAPQSGTQTRKYLRRKAEDARDTLKETGETILDAGKDVYRKGVKTVTEATEGPVGVLRRHA
jgi:gas vesicle protein